MLLLALALASDLPAEVVPVPWAHLDCEALPPGSRVDVMATGPTSTNTVVRDLDVLTCEPGRLFVRADETASETLREAARSGRLAPLAHQRDHRLVTLPVDDGLLASGLLPIGAHVDVVATLLDEDDDRPFTAILGEDLTVRGVDPTGRVTLDVDDLRLAERLVHAATVGRLTLALR